MATLAELAVTQATQWVVDKVVDKRGTREVATAYLEYLYSPEGQDIAGRNYYRPIDPAAAAKYARQFPNVSLFTIDEVFGGQDPWVYGIEPNRKHIDELMRRSLARDGLQLGFAAVDEAEIRRGVRELAVALGARP